MIYGLLVLDPMVSVTGLFLTQVTKCWSIDRMVLLFEAVKDRSEYAGWDY